MSSPQEAWVCVLDADGVPLTEEVPLVLVDGKVPRGAPVRFPQIRPGVAARVRVRTMEGTTETPVRFGTGPDDYREH